MSSLTTRKHIEQNALAIFFLIYIHVLNTDICLITRIMFQGNLTKQIFHSQMENF